MSEDCSTLQAGQCICLHVGGAGINIGHQLWLKLCEEHNLSADGQCQSSTPPPSSFFSASPSGKFSPRAVFLDCEDDATSRVRKSHPCLYNSSCLVDFPTGSHWSSRVECGSGGFYSRAHYTVGRDYAEAGQEQLRKMMECCDHLQFLLLTHSFCGGAGSGLMPRIMQKVSPELKKTTVVDFCLLPCKRYSTVTVEPYNALLGHMDMEDVVDCFVMMDNEALFNVCHGVMGVRDTTYNDVNKVTAKVISSLTALDRHSNHSTDSLSSLCTNLIPYPRVKYLMPSFAPYPTVTPNTGLNAFALMHYAARPDHHMISCDPSDGMYIACGLNYVGRVREVDVTLAMEGMRCKRGIKFTRRRNEIKTCICNIENIPCELTMLSNNSAIANKFDKLLSDFELLYSRRAFVYNFVGEGMNSGDWYCAPDSVRTVSRDYREVVKDDDDGDNDDDDDGY